MKRYLLFDGHCIECSRIARAVRDIAGGRLEPRSLHDPEMRAMVERVRPDAPAEPLLLEVNGDRVRVRSGFAMRARILRVLGPKRAFRLTERLAGGRQASGDNNGLGRRKLLTRMAGATVVSGGVLFGVGTVAGTAGADSGSGKWVTDEETLKLLRRTEVVKAASKAYGTPLWHRVLQGGTEESSFYVLRHPGEPVTFTVVQDPAIVGVKAYGISYRTKVAVGLLTIDWLSPAGGERLMRTEVEQDGSSTYTLPNGLWARSEQNRTLDGPLLDARLELGEHNTVAKAGDPTDPQAWLEFLICLAKCAVPKVPGCAPGCIACAAQGGAGPSCVSCAICVGVIALECGFQCWDLLPLPFFESGK